MIGPRPVRREDVPALKDLWREVFHDPEDMIEAFFRELFRPGEGAVVTDGDRAVSAAYVLDFGPARYIYAVGTRPEYRRRGLGRAVTLSAADGRPAYLYPADEKLREWYIRSMGAVPVSFRPALTAPAGLIPISGEEYARRREKLLSGVPHTVYSTGILRFFSLFGGFYADDRGGIRALEDGEVLEGLPCPEGGEPYILGLNGAEPLYWGLTLA